MPNINLKFSLIKPVVLIVILISIATSACGEFPPSTPVTYDSFSYSVQVFKEDTNQYVSNATVTIEVSGLAPLQGVTDTNGFVRIFIDTSYVNKPARLLVEANGYEPYRQEIDLVKDALPNIIQLKLSAPSEPLPIDTIIPTETPTPTQIPSPILTYTSTPTPTQILTPTPTNTPMPTPTHTPTNTPTPTPTSTHTPTLTPIPTPIPCPYQAPTDMETIDRLIQAEGEAVIEEDISLIRAIFAPDATIRRGDTGEHWNNPVTYYTNLFSALDFTQATHYGIQPAGPGITGAAAYFTSGSRIRYGPPGATPVFQDNPPAPPFNPSTPYGSDHWTLKKNRAGCWQITEFAFNAGHVPFPPGISFQDFEQDNGTPPGGGNYFWDAWFTTCSFSESPVYEGRRAVGCDAHAEAIGNPGDHGGTMGINPASSHPINLSSATTISVWVYDTQGNNTVELKLRDRNEAVSNNVWSTMQTVRDRWIEITWPLAKFTSVNTSQIKNLELYEWNDGIYYFDAVTWR